MSTPPSSGPPAWPPPFPWNAPRIELVHRAGPGRARVPRRPGASPARPGAGFGWLGRDSPARGRAVNRSPHLGVRVPAVGRRVAGGLVVDVAAPAGRRVLVAGARTAALSLVLPSCSGPVPAGGGRCGGSWQRPPVPRLPPVAAWAGGSPLGAGWGRPRRRVRVASPRLRGWMGCPAVVVAGLPRRLGSPDLPVFAIGCRRFFVSGTLAGSPSGNLRSIGVVLPTDLSTAAVDMSGLRRGVVACALM